ncbi:MAG: glycosyltransferase family 4 protein [Chitinophagales bacterium]|nr:glycosyltransferase family 4 protein [Chitinophagales bacterium]
MGAPQARLYETLLGLKKRGWEVLVITALPNYPKGKVFYGYRHKWHMKDEIDNIPIHRYALYASHSKKSIPRIISMLSFGFTSMFSMSRIRKFKPTYIITESPPLTLGLTGLALARLTGAKHVMNVSDIWPLSALRLGAISEGYMYKKLEGLERYLYRRSYACMGQSKEITTRLESDGSRKTLLFRNGVDFTRFETIRQSITKAERTNGLKIVYAGLLGIAQGVLDICKNIDFASLNAELHIYGEGSEKEDIRAFINKNPQRGIYLYSSVSREAIPETLMRHHATLIPLVTPIYGAVPSKIYEAMAAGLPIIFSGGGEGETLIKEHNAGWTCTPSDYKAISETIARVAKMDAGGLDIISNNCIKAAKGTFNREIQIETLDRFLLST